MVQDHNFFTSLSFKLKVAILSVHQETVSLFSILFSLSHITTETVLLARSLHVSLWSDDEWKAWCSDQDSESCRKKAGLPLVDAFTHEKSLVQAWLFKKPSAKQKNSVNQRKLTPLSVPRKHTMTTSGVKRQKQ